MKALRSRILSIALAASLLLSSGMIAAPLSAGATGETVHVLDQTKSGDVSNDGFFAWSSGNGNMFYTVNAQNGAYTFAVKALFSDGSQVVQKNLDMTVDLTKTPYLYYEVESAKDIQLLLRPTDEAGNNGDKMTVATKAGSNKIKLADVPQLQNCITADNKVSFNMFELTIAGGAVGDQAIVKKLYFGAEAEPSDDEKKVAAVEALIDALPAVEDIQLTDKEQIEEANSAYNALNALQKNMVGKEKVDALNEAVAKLNDLIYNSQTEVDKRAAKAVDDKIATIGYVMLHKEALITECRDAYNALTETQKALVTKLDVLKAAEEKLAELKANPPAENTAKTETFLDKFDDGSFPKAVKTITPREDIDINQVFSLQRECNANIYKYKFGAEFDKSSGILFKQMTEVDAAVVYEFENGLKSLEFVASYIHASIFKSAVPGVFEISWSETLDGEYTPFTASDIKYTREKIGDDYVPGDPEHEAIGNQYLAYYNIENIPAQARYIKLFFKGSEKTAEYPYKYDNWQVPLGYLKAEAYKKTVDIEENKTLTDAATGIRVTGDLPKGAELVVTDKSESGVKNALAAYLQNPAVKDYQNALSMVEIRIMVGGEVYTDFEKPLTVAFPVKEQVAGAAYYAMTYDMDIDKFTPIAGEAVDGYYQMETTWTGDFVLLGNDKAAEGFGPVDPGSKEESSDNGGAPDTGRAFPAAALLVLAGAAGAVLALRKRKS